MLSFLASSETPLPPSETSLSKAAMMSRSHQGMTSAPLKKDPTESKNLPIFLSMNRFKKKKQQMTMMERERREFACFLGFLVWICLIGFWRVFEVEEVEGGATAEMKLRG
eukprot:TRINITY_DN1863_c0_g1_i8.p1 TRINITY_DN1863_c0_g1~~TRINITY_DN1863_c0_g1_i8.p1  ORF type:complete len:110 (-),score=19.77 TRINITY_DN1863_c0_g1_i8:75-404(-)